MKSILSIVKYYLIIVLIYISLIISDIEHLLMRLLVICVSSFQISFFFLSYHYITVGSCGIF